MCLTSRMHEEMLEELGEYGIDLVCELSLSRPVQELVLHPSMRALVVGCLLWVVENRGWLFMP